MIYSDVGVTITGMLRLRLDAPQGLVVIRDSAKYARALELITRVCGRGHPAVMRRALSFAADRFSGRFLEAPQRSSHEQFAGTANKQSPGRRTLATSLDLRGKSFQRISFWALSDPCSGILDS